MTELRGEIFPQPAAIYQERGDAGTSSLERSGDED